MPALLSPWEIEGPEISAAYLLARQSFESTQSNLQIGLHPAAIFGIAAGAIFVVVITIWCAVFRVWKRMMTNREYGVLPTLRAAANGLGPANTPYGAQPSVLSSPYGPLPSNTYGPQPTNTPYDPQPTTSLYGAQPMSAPHTPYGNAPYDGQAPPPYYGAQGAGLAAQPPLASHSRSPSTGSMNKPLPTINKPLPSIHDREGGASDQPDPPGGGSQRA